ncbi:MAG: putative bifunctional diguanylate cyclase/phosphodiesterase [Thermoanaerobaculia bacterium]
MGVELNVIAALLSRCCVALVLALSIFLLHRRFSRNDLLLWGRAFLAMSAFWLAAAVAASLPAAFAGAGLLRFLISVILGGAGAASAALICWGAWELASRRRFELARARKLLIACAAGSLALALFLLILPDEPRYRIDLPLQLQSLLTGAALVWSGNRLRGHRDSDATHALLAIPFLVAGVAALLRFVSGLVAISAGVAFPWPMASTGIDSMVMMAAAVAMGMSILEDERQAALTAASQVEHIAYHDPLTGLPNRALFLDRFAVAISHASRHQGKLAILFLDIDRFKQVNDSLGHTMGDQLLKTAANRIRQTVRDEDTVARLGGDEFAILIHALAHAEHAGKVARKILDVLASPFPLGAREVFVTASLGIAIFPNDGADAEALVKNSDTAMYRAKHHGGDGYQFYTASMNSRALELLELESGLRRAMRNQELELYYQPLIDLQSGGIYGLEALLRWNHPEKGTILPDQFIPTAEVSGLIVPIGGWVVREACRQARFWQRQKGVDLVVSVNLSARQFQQPDLIDTIRLALEESRLPPRLLELEITETSAMHDVQRTIRTLHELKELGVRVAIDDFGTGYSSLSYLKQFPVDTLKLDQSFVRDLIAPQDAKIVSGVIAMAHSMSLQVMAEGVETLSQLEFLRANECDKLQGYLFSRPLPAESFDRFMTHHRAWRGIA